MDILTNSHAVLAIFFYIVFLSMFSRTKSIGLRHNKIFINIVTFTNINLSLNLLLFCVFRFTKYFAPVMQTIIIKAYLLSVIWGIFLHLCYIRNMCSKGLRFKHPYVIIINLIASVIVIFSHVEWVILWENAVDINGLSVVAAYLTAIINVILMTLYAVKSWKYLSKKIRFSLKLGGFLWYTALLTQLYFEPFLDMLGVTYVMTMFVYYYSFESAANIVDEESSLFNYEGFTKLATEMLDRKKHFDIIYIYLKNLTYVEAQFGHEECVHILQQINSRIATITKHPACLYKENGILIITDASENPELSQRVHNILATNWNIQNTNINLEEKIMVIDSSYISSFTQISGILDFLRDYNIKTPPVEDIMMVGPEIVEKQIRTQNIISLLQSAIANDGFNIFFQPIYDVKKGLFNSAEALIRMKDTQTIGFISPEEFIPIAEKNGLITQIGNIVFEKVCVFAAEQKLWNMGVEYIEINLSAIQSVDTSLPSQLTAIMEKYNINPSFINLEITETAAVKSDKQLTENMYTLRKLGCSFSMDDFGTGYSNLSKITSMGYEIIKLDKSLIWPCFGEGDRHKPIVILENIVNMILKLDIKIVAEGVENEAQVKYLTDLGIQYLQGYFYSRPVPFDEYIKFIIERNHK